MNFKIEECSDRVCEIYPALAKGEIIRYLITVSISRDELSI